MSLPALYLRVTDFQRVEDALVEVLGITFLKGLNNQGKTSLLRAAHAAAAGRMGEKHVRKGQKKATVAIDFPEDPDNPAVQVCWRKGSSGAEYFINGKPFTALGRRGVPLEDLEKIGIKEMKYSGGSNYLMFALKGEPSFLVDLPPTQVFDYVSKVLQERHIIPVIKAMAADASALNSGLVALEGEIQTRKQSILSWGGVQQQLQEVLQYQPQVQDLQKEMASLRRMYLVRDEIRQIQATGQAHLTRVEEQEKFLAAVEPLVSEIESETKTLKKMRESYRELQTVESNLEDTRKRLQVVQDQIEKFPDLDAAEKLTKELVTERETLKRMKALRASLVEVVDSAKNTEKKLSGAAKDLADAEEGFERIKKEIGVCPTCGSHLGGHDG